MVRRDDFPLHEELRGGQRPGDRDDLRKARGDVAEPPTEDADRLALPVDLNSCAVELVFDRGLATVFRQDLVEVFGHFREHRLHRSEKTQAPGPKRVRALEQGNLRDQPEVPEEHVGRPDGIRVDTRGVGDPFEHHAFVHTDPHLAEDVLQEDVPFLLRGAAQERFEQPPSGPRRVRAMGFCNLREGPRDVEDGERSWDQRRLFRPVERFLERRPPDVQGTCIRFGEDPADDQVHRGRDFVSPEGTKERGQ